MKINLNFVILFFFFFLLSKSSFTQNNEQQFLDTLEKLDEIYNELSEEAIKKLSPGKIAKKMIIFFYLLNKLEEIKNKLLCDEQKKEKAKIAYFETAKIAYFNDFAIYKNENLLKSIRIFLSKLLASGDFNILNSDILNLIAEKII